MAKTRMLKADREVLLTVILAHKFDPIFAALRAEEGELAVSARLEIYGAKTVAWIDAAPEGALPVARTLDFSVGGRCHMITFPTPMRIFDREDHRRHMLDATSPLGERIVAFYDKEREAKGDREKLKRVTEATLAEFRSFDDLAEAWPEAQKFILARWQSRPDYRANVPAVVIKDLSTALDLPPEELAAAA